MTMQPEHKPDPRERIAAENARAAGIRLDPTLSGRGVAHDADVLRVIAELDPVEIARISRPRRARVVGRSLAHPFPPGSLGWVEPGER